MDIHSKERGYMEPEGSSKFFAEENLWLVLGEDKNLCRWK